MKLTYKNRKAFTLIELLIVIAIIGILFIVLVSKVDFATDKAKATGVQTDFRSFQVAFEQVAKENAGFNTFGWDTGDTNGDRVRNSYDAGDANQDGVQQDDEVWTGRKVYAETWTGTYTLVKPGTTDLDADAIFALESAINKNLDPKLHITIHDDGTISMANQATDPWKNEYHGRYLSNAGVDGLDRGAIFMYSDGANGENGSADGIAGGLVNITTPGNNVQGKDDYAVATFYSYANGYGEVKTVTHGFSNNQTFNDGSAVPTTPVGQAPNVVVPSVPGTPEEPTEPTGPVMPAENPSGTVDSYSWSELKLIAQAKMSAADLKAKYGIELGQKKDGKYWLVDLDGNEYEGFVFMYDTGRYGDLMNDAAVNLAGYAYCKMATTTMPAIYSALESSNPELTAAMKEINIVCNKYGDVSQTDNKTNTLTTKLFLPSVKEVGVDASGWTYPEGYLLEGSRFDYLTSMSRLAQIAPNKDFWLRSANTSQTVAFAYFNAQYVGVTTANANMPYFYTVAAFVIG